MSKNEIQIKAPSFPTHFPNWREELQNGPNFKAANNLVQNAVSVLQRCQTDPDQSSKAKKEFNGQLFGARQLFEHPPSQGVASQAYLDMIRDGLSLVDSVENWLEQALSGNIDQERILELHREQQTLLKRYTQMRRIAVRAGDRIIDYLEGKRTKLRIDRKHFRTKNSPTWELLMNIINAAPEKVSYRPKSKLHTLRTRLRKAAEKYKRPDYKKLADNLKSRNGEVWTKIPNENFEVL